MRYQAVLWILFATLLLVLFQGCGSNQDSYREFVKLVEVPGTPVEVPQQFEGLFFFEEVPSGIVSGPVELVVNYNGNIRALQPSNNFKLISKNFNGTFGTHPRINFNNAQKSTENSFSVGMDVTYAQSDDLEKDGTNNDLGNGKHYTIYEFSMDNDGLINLTIKIYDGNLTDNGGINDLVVTRVFKGL